MVGNFAKPGAAMGFAVSFAKRCILNEKKRFPTKSLNQPFKVLPYLLDQRLAQTIIPALKFQGCENENLIMPTFCQLCGLFKTRLLTDGKSDREYAFSKIKIKYEANETE